ncbi:hypothetical protein BU17DRAFT_68795 [Hysterangium stoloniferum]|nr:hypothetical protein BU17DRAFT_68795 [Hysterangium stoloniferum]
MSARPHRREHLRRADRLEARFDPLNPNVPPEVSKSSSTPADPKKKATPTVSLISNPVLPTTTSTPVQVLPPSVVTSLSTSLTVVTPLVSSTSSSSIPTPVSSSTSTTSLVRTSPSLVTTPTVQRTPTINSVPVAAFSTMPSASFSSTTPSPTGTPSSGMGGGTIAGIAAGCLAGIVILGVAGMWLIKRYSQSREEESDATPFTRHSWMRNSVALPDDGPAPPPAPSSNPRPPTMIERKQANLAGRGYPQGGLQGYGQGGFGQGQPTYGPAPSGYMSSPYQDSPYGRPPMGYAQGQQVMPPHQQTFSPIASPPLHPPSPSIIDETAPPVSYNNAHPVYFTRHDSMQSDVQSPQEHTLPNPYEASQGAGYATLDRASVTPYQAKQYAEISRQLEASGPLPSPFEDPVPSATNQRVDSSPPVLPAMRAMSPVTGAMHSNDMMRAMSPPAARGFAVPSPISIPSPASPKSPSFKAAMPMSPAVVTVPADMHVGRETPVQFGFNEPAVTAEISAPPAAVVKTPTTSNPKRMSMASKKSVVRPETMYDEEDAYGGI